MGRIDCYYYCDSSSDPHWIRWLSGGMKRGIEVVVGCLAVLGLYFEAPEAMAASGMDTLTALHGEHLYLGC